MRSWRGERGTLRISLEEVEIACLTAQHSATGRMIHSRYVTTRSGMPGCSGNCATVTCLDGISCGRPHFVRSGSQVGGAPLTFLHRLANCRPTSAAAQGKAAPGSRCGLYQAVDRRGHSRPRGLHCRQTARDPGCPGAVSGRRRVSLRNGAAAR